VTGFRPIRSRSNRFLARLRALTRSPERRRTESVYLAEGVRWAEEALGIPDAIAAAMVSPRLSQSERGRRLLRKLAALPCPRHESSDRLLDGVAESRSPQGVVLLMRRPPDRMLAWLRGALDPAGLWVVSVGIQDPGNQGGLARTAWALGASGMVCHGGADLFHPRAVRASSGALLHFPVGQVGSEEELHEFLRSVEARAAVPSGGEDPRRLDWSGRCALVLGSEAHGLPESVRAACVARVSVPMSAGSHSLSVGAAAAALLALIGAVPAPGGVTRAARPQ
jgi:TrmH family RNA methyltransferase